MFEHGFPEHWSTLKKFVWLVGTGIIGGASAIWKTVTGTFIHITDALASPMQKCEVSLEPKQDLHGQDAPYPAGGGSNKFDGISYNTYIPLNLVAGDRLYAQCVPSEASKYLVIRTYDSEKNFLRSITTTQGSTIKYNALITETAVSYIQVQTSEPESFSDVIVGVGDDSLPVTFHPYSNICPITGWTGCEVRVRGSNLLNLNRTLGLPSDETYNYTTKRTFNESEYVKNITSGNYYNKNYTLNCAVGENGITIEATSNSMSYGVGLPVNIPENTRVVISATAENGGVKAAFYKADGTFISGRSVTLGTSFVTPSETYQMVVIFITTSVSNNATFTNICLNFGTTSSDYALYNPSSTTLSVTFPDSAGTVYGGTVDLVSGAMNINYWYNGVSGDVRMLDGYIGQEYTRFYKPLAHPLISGARWAIADLSPIVAYDGLTIIHYRLPNSATGIDPNTDTIQTAITKINTYLSTHPIHVCYTSTDTRQYQLTPQEISTLAGENNVWSNTNGDTEITYKAQA